MTVTSATMDFFESQEAAKRKTILLILYFILALIFIICGVYLAVLLVLMFSGEKMHGLWHPSIFLYVVAGVMTVVLIGSLYKIIVLSKGGDKVAEMLGGTPVDPNTRDPDKRKLLNVVEEMAIASGVVVPRVYVLEDEKGINAFAAGLTPGNAVVAVTSGCMKQLDRDELQGVVAHEFSHILNGDMRLNIRLMGVINGILIIAILGRAILRGMSSGRSRSSSQKGGGQIAALALGLALIVVGYIGVLFGKLIKSAVSRQREFLADAAAVQFTRNPSGIAGALKKIAELKAGSRIGDRHAEEASHLFFSDGLSKAFLHLLSTHPPIIERIRRIDPRLIEMSTEEMIGWKDDARASAKEELLSFQAESGLKPDEFISQVGNPQLEHLAVSKKVLSDLPPLLSEAAHEPFGARALVYCLLINKEKEVRDRQIRRLESYADPYVMGQTQKLLPVVDTLDRGYRLPLMDIAIPSLKNLSDKQYEAFSENVKHVVEADQRITLFEYAIQRMIKCHLDPLFRGKKAPRAIYRAFNQIQIECRELLSILAWQGSKDGTEADKAFKQGMEAFDSKTTFSILSQEQCNLKLLDRILETLSKASPRLKKQILKASVQCISSDRLITANESELIRAVVDSLDCPVPPIYPGAVENHPVH
jgi:Zn-dependent protease with chaperone function